MAANSKVAPAISRKPPAKLSSGIMGMKFMQKDDSPADEQVSEAVREAPKKEVNKFVHEEDPGAWFDPRSQNLKAAVAQASSRQKDHKETLSYSDIFETPPQTGRKSFGAKPPSIDPEETVKKPAKKESVSKGRKRHSEEGRRLSEGGSDNIKKGPARPKSKIQRRG